MKVLLNTESMVRFRIRREYNRFQYQMLKKKKEEIMEKCEKIRFYGCIKEFFQYNEGIPQEIFSFLSKQKDIIHSMWEIYLKYEQLSCESWDQIEKLIGFWMVG
mgnify:FL=1